MGMAGCHYHHFGDLVSGGVDVAINDGFDHLRYGAKSAVTPVLLQTEFLPSFFRLKSPESMSL